MQLNWDKDNVNAKIYNYQGLLELKLAELYMMLQRLKEIGKLKNH